MSEKKQEHPKAHTLEVDITADPVESPIVHYGDPLTAILFPTVSERGGRVTFENLDALRVCRGEYSPYETEPQSGRAWIFTVSESPWLRERYEYESNHYRNAYEFCGDVDEMIRDFNHYLFRFHDQFVEAIAGGIWIEDTDGTFDGNEIPTDHPLLPLPESSVIDRIQAHELVCQVRQSPTAIDQLIKNASLCSQPLYDFALQIEGMAKVDWRLSLRCRNGQLIR